MHITPRIVCLSLLILLPFGCGYSSDLSRKVITGSVTCDGESVPSGFVRFVPTGDTRGPTTAARIIDGKYRADNRNGVPLGTHRVEITAQRPTGKKIEVSEGEFMVKMENIGDKKYAGKQSPLTAEVTADGDGRMDFDISQ